jgi:hypothetical protein
MLDPITATALIVAGGLYLLNSSNASASTVGNAVRALLLPSYVKTLSANQLYMIYIIEREFLAAGLPLSIACAAVVNAVAESGLNPSAPGDSGHSIGLFQLHDGGAGKGMSVADRKDPAINTRRIIKEVKDSFGKELRRLASQGATIAQLSAIFSRDIERPKDKQGEMDKRYAKAEKMFGVDRLIVV